MASEMGQLSLQFGATSALMRVVTQVPLLTNSKGEANEAGELAASSMAGALVATVASPCELCMIQQQRFGGSIGSTMSRLVSEHGAGVLGRGVTMALGRESMFTMSMLGVTPLIQEKLVERSGLDKNVALAAGSLAGALLAGVVTHPMDTIKTCMQGDCAQAKYTGILPTGQAIVAEHGLARGLFNGLFWRISLISTTFFLVNTFKQKTVPLLFPHAVEKSK